MANLNVAVLIAASDRLSAPLRGMSGALGGMEAKLRAGARSAGEFNTKWAKTIQMSRQVGAGMMVAGGALLAGATVAVRAGAQEEAAQDRLRKIYGARAEQLIEFASLMQQQTRFADDEVVAAAAIGATYVGLRGDMETAIRAAANMSEAYGMDLTQAMHMLGRASGGMVTNMRRVGIMVDQNDFKARGMVAVYDQIAKETKNVAFTSDSASKRLAQFTNAWSDLQEQVGYALLPLLKEYTPKIVSATKDLQEFAATPLGEKLIKWSVGAGAFMLAAGPLLIALPHMLMFVNQIIQMSGAFSTAAAKRAASVAGETVAVQANTTALMANAAARKAIVAAAANAPGQLPIGAGGSMKYVAPATAVRSLPIGAMVTAAMPYVLAALAGAGIAYWASGLGGARQEEKDAARALADAIKAMEDEGRTKGFASPFTGKFYPSSQRPTTPDELESFYWRERNAGGKRWDEVMGSRPGAPMGQRDVTAFDQATAEILNPEYVAKKKEQAAAAEVAATKKQTDGLREYNRALRDAAIDRRNAGEAMEEAQRGVAEAHEDAARRIAEAERQVADALRGVNEARKRGIELVEAARQQAADAEKSAAQRVAEAEQAIKDFLVPPTEYELRQREWKRLVEERAAAHGNLKDTQERNAKAIAEAEAEAAQLVVDAQERVLEAREALTQAHKDGARAIEQAVRRERDAAESLASTWEATADRIEAARARIIEAGGKVPAGSANWTATPTGWQEGAAGTPMPSATRPVARYLGDWRLGGLTFGPGVSRATRSMFRQFDAEGNRIGAQLTEAHPTETRIEWRARKQREREARDAKLQEEEAAGAIIWGDATMPTPVNEGNQVTAPQAQRHVTRPAIASVAGTAPQTVDVRLHLAPGLVAEQIGSPAGRQAVVRVYRDQHQRAQ